MHEATQISYGYGVVNIIMNSESTTEIPAPDIRFGDYKETLKSCFTQKELKEIEDGGTAELTFNFVMMDELEDRQESDTFDAALQKAQKKSGTLEKGVYFEVEGTKTIGEGETTELTYFYSDMEFQMDVPLYLVKEGREYYAMTDVMGECHLTADADKDADTFTISTHDLGTTLILYQDMDPNAGDSGAIHFNGNYVILAGLLALAIAWFSVDRLHRKERAEEKAPDREP